MVLGMGEDGTRGCSGCGVALWGFRCEAATAGGCEQWESWFFLWLEFSLIARLSFMLPQLFLPRILFSSSLIEIVFAVAPFLSPLGISAFLRRGNKKRGEREPRSVPAVRPLLVFLQEFIGGKEGEWDG